MLKTKDKLRSRRGRVDGEFRCHKCGVLCANMNSYLDHVFFCKSERKYSTCGNEPLFIKKIGVTE